MEYRGLFVVPGAGMSRLGRTGEVQHTITTTILIIQFGNNPTVFHKQFVWKWTDKLRKCWIEE